MWISFLFGLISEIGMTWSLFMDPPDLGVSIDVTKGFLFNDFNMRVIHNPDVNENNIYPEWANQIFKNDFTTVSYNFNSTEVNVTYQIEKCSNVEQLLIAYFRDINVDGVPSSWQIFARHWFADRISRKGKVTGMNYIAEAISKRFGIPIKYISNDFSYILIKTSLTQHEAEISASLMNLDFLNNVEKWVQKISTDAPDDYIHFFRRFGTHFLSSYATGGSLYQVLVYTAENFLALSEAFPSRLKLVNGIKNLTQTQRLYLSPNFALHVGNILSADTNNTIEKWAEKVCTTQSSDQSSYPNLLELYDNSTVLNDYKNIVQNKAVVKLKMSSNMKAILRNNYDSSELNKYHRREL